MRAAAVLFSEHGYAATSVRGIADEAGVSPETVYAAFGTKAAVLRAWIDVSVVGDDAPLGLAERIEAIGLRGLTPEARLGHVAHAVRGVHERTVVPLSVLAAAARDEPGLAVLARGLVEARRADAARLLGQVFAGTPRRADLTRTRLLDLVVTLTSVDVYRALVVECGWSAAAYESELVRLLRDSVLATGENSG